MSDKPKNIYAKIQQSRVDMLEHVIEKTGKNEISKFKYFELGDFIANANKVLNQNGLCPIFNITHEKAVLVVYDTDFDSKVTFYTPIGIAMNPKMNVTPIQDIGARHTYAKRYLYMNLLEIGENDPVNAQDNTQIEGDKASKKPSKAHKEQTPTNTPETTTDMPEASITLYQVKKIKDAYAGNDEKLERLLKSVNLERVEDMKFKQAQELIKKLDEIKA